MIAFPTVLAFAGQNLQVARMKAVIVLLLQPLIIAPERHAAVMILGQEQRLR
jgi:hypothetical protein